MSRSKELEHLLRPLAPEVLGVLVRRRSVRRVRRRGQEALLARPCSGRRRACPRTHISRAKATIKASGAVFELPPDAAGDARVGSVLHVLYLIFNEGYAASSGTRIQRVALAEEAIRLTRMLQRLLPGDDEVRGLLALMLLTHARRGARTAPDGALIPLAEQDRARWDRVAIAEGVGLISGALSAGMVGPFQLQAAIAAVHAEAPSTAETDWREITVLYELLERIAPNPVFTLNHAVAVAMFRGPAAALELLGEVEHDERLAGRHRVAASPRCAGTCWSWRLTQPPPQRPTTPPPGSRRACPSASTCSDARWRRERSGERAEDPQPRDAPALFFGATEIEIAAAPLRAARMTRAGVGLYPERLSKSLVRVMRALSVPAAVGELRNATIADALKAWYPRRGRCRTPTPQVIRSSAARPSRCGDPLG